MLLDIQDESFDIASLLTGDRNKVGVLGGAVTDGDFTDELQDVAILSAILSTVYDILDADVELRRQMPFSISVPAQRDSGSLGSLAYYQGPEEETVMELTNRHEQWLRDPDLFWRPPTMPDFSRLQPEAQIVGRFIARDRSDK